MRWRVKVCRSGHNGADECEEGGDWVDDEDRRE